MHRFCNWAVAALFAVSAIGLVYVWWFWEPLYGESLQNLITVSLIGLLLLIGVLWLLICSRLPRRFVWTVAALYVGLTTACAASVRRVEFSGDMRATLEWRWQSTAADRLRQYQAQQTKPPADASADAAVVSTAELAVLQPEDMPGYRGLRRDGQIIGPLLPEDWTTQPPRLLWKHPVGGGYSQFAVAGQRLVTLEQRGAEEAVVCYDAQSGAELWAHAYPALFDEAMGGPGPRSTPTLHAGQVYALGATGELSCLNLGTGAPVWRRSLLTEYGLDNQIWAMTSSPLVADGRLFVNIGTPFGGGLLALDPQTGAELWKGVGLLQPGVKPALVAAAETEVPAPSGSDEHGSAASGGGDNRAGYSSPQLSMIAGETLLLNFDGKGLWAHRPEDGEALWFFHFENGAGVNAAQPIVFPDGRVFLSASYGVGAEMLQVSRTDGAWNVKSLWKNLNMRCKMTSPVLLDGVLYGLDEGMLTALDPETGQRLWKGSRKFDSRGKYGHGQLLTTNGRIVVLSEQGDVVLIRPDRTELQELATFHVLDGPKTWNPPALSRGRLFVRNHYEMAGYELCSP
jgi:outer membrane protein assembly factor BamB